MPDAFYEPDGQGFRATELTRGPWDVDAQHVGPPAALLAERLSEVEGGDGKRLARLSVDILGPVPIGVMEISTRVLRPGRRVDLVEAELHVAGRLTTVARAWRHRTGSVEVPAIAASQPPPGDPATAEPIPFFDVPWDVGYHTAIELRATEGSILEPGPATIWFHTDVQLVAGRDLSPIARVFVVADSGNGASAVLNPREALFVNTELTVHLHRPPTGEWIGMRARTTIADDGVGVAGTTLYDADGAVGRGSQALYVETP